jgi:hypothetical protein
LSSCHITWIVPVLLVALFETSNPATIISDQFNALLGYTFRNQSQEQSFAFILNAEYILYSGPLVYGGLIYADLNICQFENFLIPSFSPKSYSKPPRNEELEDLAAQPTQKQQQQKQEELILWSIETHELQKMLAGIDRYLQRLGNTDPDWEWSCSITRRVSAVLQS